MVTLGLGGFYPLKQIVVAAALIHLKLGDQFQAAIMAPQRLTHGKSGCKGLLDLIFKRNNKTSRAEKALAKEES